MRSLGLPELLVILGLLALLMGGKRISGLMGWLGRKTKGVADQARYVYESLGGSEEDVARAETPVGERLARQVRQQFPEDPDPAAQELVARIGKRLATGEGTRDREFTFQIVQAEAANAFALPGGFVFVTRPLLDLCDGDEAEVAFLLGHEMEHIILRHAAEKYVVDMALTATKVGRLAGKLLGTGYSREQEREADLKGVRLAVEAGFEAEGGVRALKKLRQLSPEASAFQQYLSTHPSTTDRIASIEASLTEPSQ